MGARAWGIARVPAAAAKIGQPMEKRAAHDHRRCPDRDQRSYALARTLVPWAKRRPGVRRRRFDPLAARKRDPRRPDAIRAGDAVHWPDFLFAVPLALAGARVLPPLRVRRRAYSSGGHCLGGGIDRFGIFLLALYRTARTPAPRQAVHDRGLRPCRRIDRRGCWAGCRRAARISGETVPGRPRHEQPGGNVEMGVSAAREARWTSAAIVLRVRSKLVRREDQGRALGR